MELPTGDHGDYMRVLMLPELRAANQPATLITAYAPFQEFNRLHLNSFGEVSNAQLTRRIFSTGSISQFTFRAEQLETNTAEPGTTKSSSSDPDDFDSVWDD